MTRIDWYILTASLVWVVIWGAFAWRAYRILRVSIPPADRLLVDREGVIYPPTREVKLKSKART